MADRKQSPRESAGGQDGGEHVTIRVAGDGVIVRVQLPLADSARNAAEGTG
jgi:hypothetical protein